MIIRSVDFIISAANKRQFPSDNLPQVVFAGRSNVGKSSFINALLNNSKVARTSQTPGKTRLINFFLINKAFYFVDLPGYGYANVDKQTLAQFRVLIEGYLESFSPVRAALLLLDIRRIPSSDDVLMQKYFQSRGFDIIYILTKADKLSNNQRQKQIKLIKDSLKPGLEEPILLFSAKTGENRDAVLEQIAINVGWEE
jgi:GTP-binding protein